MKLTPWFNGNVKPVRVGIYQRKWESGVVYTWWTGKHWCWFGHTIEHALKFKTRKSLLQTTKKWRGVRK